MKINNIVFGFKETFWSESSRDTFCFFTFIIVMISLVLPLLSRKLAGFFAIFILLVALSYTLDSLYDSGILKEPKKEGKDLRIPIKIKIKKDGKPKGGI